MKKYIQAFALIFVQIKKTIDEKGINYNNLIPFPS